MADELMVTTIDNPFNPFTDFDAWRSFDVDHGYYTLEYMARLTDVTSDNTEDEYNEAINDAVKRICRLNLLGIYRAIGPDDKPEPRPIVLET